MHSRRQTRAGLGLVAAAAAVMLSGCVMPPAAPGASNPGTAAPTPSSTAPLSTGSATPTPTGSATPAPTGSATPAPTSSANPEPTSGVALAPYCGDEYVLHTNSTGPTSWIGTDEEILASAEAQGGFEPAAALEGLDVHCTVTYRSPIDGADGMATISTAVLLRDDAAFAQLEQWSTANGYDPTPGADPSAFEERYAPANADGTTTTKILWMPLDGEVEIGGTAEIIATTGAPPDAIMVWFSDFTQP